jgi:hypothetical protein
MWEWVSAIKGVGFILIIYDAMYLLGQVLYKKIGGLYVTP